MIRRAAAIPAAPAPTTTTSASRGTGTARTPAANIGVSARLADAVRKARREIVMSWFPEICKSREYFDATVQQIGFTRAAGPRPQSPRRSQSKTHDSKVFLNPERADTPHHTAAEFPIRAIETCRNEPVTATAMVNQS